MTHTSSYFFNLALIFTFPLFSISVCPTTLTDTSVNFMINGDFQTPYLGPMTHRFTSEPLYGWTTAFKIEQGTGAIYNSRWGTHTQVIEIDTFQNQMYNQTLNLPACQALLTISFAARQGLPLSSSGLRIWWNDQSIMYVQTFSDYLIHTQTFTLQAVQGNNFLTLEARGTSDGAGTSIDNVLFNRIVSTNRIVVNGQCQCEPGYFDDMVNTECQSCLSRDQNCLQCSNSNGFTCNLCKPKFVINPQGQCKIQCQQLQNTNGNSQQSLNQCICKQTYSWNSSILECVRVCSNSVVPYAINLVNGSNTDCNCEQKFIWKSNISACYIDCSNIANALQNLDGLNNQCTCKTGFSWSSLILECKRNCNDIMYALGELAGSNTICRCINNFYWNNTLQKCKFNCSLQLNTDSSKASSQVNKCFCKEKYLWNESILKCTIQCQNIPHSGLVANGSINQCNCESQKFFWSFQKDSCVIKCSSILFTDGIIEGAVDICKCSNKFIWDQSQLSCKINCREIQDTNGIEENSIDKCKCKSKFKWDSQKKVCVAQCQLISNSNGLVEGKINQCRCSAGLIWNRQFSQCFVDCSLIPNAKGSLVNKCQCVSGYKYKENVKKCILSCQDIEFTLKEAQNTEQIYCSCLAGFIWNQFEVRCQYNCSADSNSTGLSEQGFDKCECIPDNFWNSEKMICQTKTIDIMLTAIIGSGVVCKICIYLSCRRSYKCCICISEEETISSQFYEGHPTRANIYSLMM